MNSISFQKDSRGLKELELRRLRRKLQSTQNGFLGFKLTEFASFLLKKGINLLKTKIRYHLYICVLLMNLG